MRIRLKKGEKLLKKGLGNHHSEGKKEGGRLYLTNKKLYFVPYNVDNKNRPIELLISNMEEVDLVKAHGIIGYGVIIICKNGKISEFFIYGRKHWAKEIERLIAEQNTK